MQMQAVRRVCIPVDECVSDGRKTVLLVTTDADLRASGTRALGAAGFHVLAASHSGHATLAALTSGRVDILASDLTMDDVSGPALAERLRRHHPGLQTLFFADAGTPECDGVVVRPFTRDDLLTAIVEVP